MNQAVFSRRFKGSPVKRTKQRGLPRNGAVALGRIEAGGALDALRMRMGVEEDAWVREKIVLALVEAVQAP